MIRNDGVARVDEQARLNLLIRSDTIDSASGASEAVIPSAGHKLRIHFLSYNPSIETQIWFQWGASDPGINRILWFNAKAGSIIMKDFKAFNIYLEGAVNQSLYINQIEVATTIWNVFYEEVLPS